MRETRREGTDVERNFETVMIEQCAPVLASLKPAGLFRYETRDCADPVSYTHLPAKSRRLSWNACAVIFR